MGTVLLFLFFFVASYQFFLNFSHPLKRKRRVPRVAYKNIELLPNVRFHFRNKTYHFHHWLLLSVCFVIGFVIDGFSHLLFLNAALIGGIAQGLRFPNRFHLCHPRGWKDPDCC